MSALLLAGLLALPAAARARIYEPADWTPAFAELKTHLQGLIRLDTSNPPGNELLAARYLKEALDRESIASNVYVSTGSRASLIARLKGDGTRRPLLLMCHTDVVPAERARWSVDPFGAVEKNGYVWGRGAADIKGMCATELLVLELLNRARAPLKRDVIFFAQADEEVGGTDRHLTWLLREHGAALDAEYGLNEGGHTLWKDGRIAAVHLQAAEKQYLDVRLTARGTPGHASVPRPDNAVFALGRALARLSEWKAPLERQPAAMRFLTDTAAESSPERRRLIARLAGPGWKAAARRLEELDPETGALFHDTVAATMARGGYKANVVPSEAEATVNCRLMPGRDPKAFVRAMSAAMREPSVEVAYDADATPSPAMPPESALVDAVRVAAGELAPGARVSPFMSAWSTDSPSLRARGVKVYGLDPPLSAEDTDRVHGDDERVSVEAMDAYLRLLYRVTLRLAAEDL